MRPFRKSIIAAAAIVLTATAALAQSITTSPQLVGFGTLALTNASTLLSTLTVGPNSPAWPASLGQVYVLNDSASAGNVYVCPLGGTCTTANGLELTPGRSWSFYRFSTNATVIAATTATVQVQW